MTDLVEALCDLADRAVDKQKAVEQPRAEALEPPAQSDFLKGADLRTVQKLADARVKEYTGPSADFRSILDSLARFSTEHLSHADAKRLVWAAGATNINRVHWGSAIDALLTAIPAQFLKLPLRYLVPIGAADLQLTNVVASGALEDSGIEGLSKALEQPVLGANRNVVRAITKPAHEFGIFGRGVAPGKHEADHSALTCQLEKTLADLRAVLASRFAQCVRTENGALQDLAAQDDAALERLRDDLVEELKREFKKNVEFLKVMALDERIAAQVVMALATFSVQMIARIAAGALLAPAGLMPLAKLVSPIVATLIAPLVKATVNRQDTLSVARDVLRKYRELEERFGIAPETELVEFAHSAQDQFQSSAQARYWRRLENVCMPTLRKLGIELSEAQYEVDELASYPGARNEDEYSMIEEILRYQRKLNCVDSSFSPLTYLDNARAAVDRLIDWSGNARLLVSDLEFEGLLSRNAAEILTVEASPDKDDGLRLKKLLEADARRFGRKEFRSLQPLYRYKKKRLTRRVVPLAPKPVPSFTLALASPRSAKFLKLDAPLKYLEKNVDIVEDRDVLARKIGNANQQLSELKKKKLPEAGRLFGMQMMELEVKRSRAHQRYAKAQRKYAQYAQDVRLFQDDEIDKLDPKGKLVEQLLDNTWGVRVTMSNLVKHDLWQACRARIFNDVAMPFGQVLAFEAVRPSLEGQMLGRKPDLMLRTQKSQYTDGKRIRTRVKFAKEASVKRAADFKNARELLNSKRQQIGTRKPFIPELHAKVDAIRKAKTKLQIERGGLSVLKPWHWKKLGEIKKQVRIFDGQQKECEDAIKEYDGWIGEELLLKAAHDKAFAILTATEKFSALLAQHLLPDGSYSCDGLIAMVDQLETLAIADRYSEFNTLLKCNTDESLRHVFLAKLASKVDLLSIVDRGLACESIAGMVKSMSSEMKMPVLELLVWNVGDASQNSLSQLFGALLDVGEMEPAHLQIYLGDLLKEIWRLPPSDRKGVLMSIVGACKGLSESGKAEILSKVSSMIEMLPGPERKAAFDEWLGEINKLPASQRSVALDVLIDQIEGLPKEVQMQAFGSMLDSIRTVKTVSVEVHTPARTEKGAKGMPPVQHAATVHIEQRIEVDYLTRSDGSSHLEHVLDQASSLHESNRLAAFEKSINIARESSGEERIDAYACATSQLDTLNEADKKAAYTKVVFECKSMKTEDQIDYLLQNFSHFPVEVRISILECVGELILDLPWRQRVDAAHALALQLDFMPAGDLLRAFRKILALLAKFTTDQLNENDTCQLLLDLSLGVLRATDEERAEMRRDLEDLRTRGGFFQYDVDRGHGDRKDLSNAQIFFSVLDRINAGGQILISAVPGSFLKAASAGRGPYKIFAAVGSGLHYRFRNVVSRHFSNLLSVPLPGRVIVGAPESRIAFVKQIYKGPTIPDCPLMVKKPKFSTASETMSSDDRSDGAGSPLSFSRPTTPDEEVKPILPENIPDYISRGDSRPPEVILRTGFHPRGTDDSMSRHLHGGSSGTAYVSFSRSAEDIKFYALRTSVEGVKVKYGYRYTLKSPEKTSAVYQNWYDVQYAYPTSTNNSEIAIKGHVPPDSIVRIDKIEAHPTDPNKFRIAETYYPKNRPGISSGLV